MYRNWSIGGFRSDLSIARKTDGNFGNVSAGVLGCLIPEILVGIQMEKFVSVSSDRNIRDHLWRWSTFDKPVPCPN